MLPKQSNQAQRDRVLKRIIESQFRDPVIVMSYQLDNPGIVGVFYPESEPGDVFDFKIRDGNISYAPRSKFEREDGIPRTDDGKPCGAGYIDADLKCHSKGSRVSGQVIEDLVTRLAQGYSSPEVADLAGALARGSIRFARRTIERTNKPGVVEFLKAAFDTARDPAFQFEFATSAFDEGDPDE